MQNHLRVTSFKRLYSIGHTFTVNAFWIGDDFPQIQFAFIKCPRSSGDFGMAKKIIKVLSIRKQLDKRSIRLHADFRLSIQYLA